MNLEYIKALVAGTVEHPCGVLDQRGYPCGLERGHPDAPQHCRLAEPGELAYQPGPGNSVITWTEARRLLESSQKPLKPGKP